MNKTLRVLQVEDSERDAALLTRHLSRAGYELISERVETPEAMRAALEAQEWDVILCDYSMPHFNALSALALLKEMELEIPFIIISGTIGEEVAVEAMRAGAHDYLMKDKLARLAPAIERELLESENRRARRRAEDALRFQKSPRWRRQKTPNTRHSFCGGSKQIVSHNKRFLELWDIPAPLPGEADEVTLSHAMAKVAKPQEFLARVEYLYQHADVDSHEEIELLDGRTFDRYSAPIKSGDDEYYGRVWFFRDITERKQAEVVLRERIDLQEQLAQIAATSPGVLYSFRLLPDGSSCFPYASPAVEDLFGFQASDLARDGSDVFANIHPDDIDLVQAKIAESARTSSLWSDEFRFLHSLRGQIWVMASSVPKREPDGSILWRGFAMDITERKRQEADLLRLAAAVEQTADSVVVTDPEGNIQYVNPAFRAHHRLHPGRCAGAKSAILEGWPDGRGGLQSPMGNDYAGRSVGGPTHQPQEGWNAFRRTRHHLSGP